MRGVNRTILVLFPLLLWSAPLHADQTATDKAGYTLFPEGVAVHLQSQIDRDLEGMLLAGLPAKGPMASGGADDDAEDMEDFGLEAEFEEASAKKVFDPLSGYNRIMTQVNDRIYFWLLKPVARGYGAVLPEGARLSVGRFFNNLLMPVRFVNNLLQLKFQRAGTELTRFMLNTTVGILGFGDPAQKWFDLQPYPEDFGQTLGHYGIGGGFHLVLPVLGPSNLRDTLGLVPDYFLTPVSYIEEWEVEFAVRSYDEINHTSLHIGEYESVKKDAVDLYSFLRDAYEQSRNEKIEE